MQGPEIDESTPGHGEKRAPPRRKSFFFRGLVTALPAVLTVFILFSVVQFAQTYVTGPINSAIYWLLEGNALGWKVLRRVQIEPYSLEYLDVEALPPELQKQLEASELSAPAFQADLRIHRESHEAFLRDPNDLAVDPQRLRRAVRGVVHPMIGVLASLLLVLTLGYLASGYFGRRLAAKLDRTLHQVPVIRSVYPYTKQVVDFFLSEKELDLGTVVAAPYPSDGVWSIGFVTSSGLKSLHDDLGGTYVSIFMPSSPVPMTGYTVFMELRRLVPLSLTVDEALRVTVSAGVLIPPQERVEGLEQLMRGLLDAQRPAQVAANATAAPESSTHSPPLS